MSIYKDLKEAELSRLKKMASEYSKIDAEVSRLFSKGCAAEGSEMQKKADKLENNMFVCSMMLFGYDYVYAGKNSGMIWQKK